MHQLIVHPLWSSVNSQLLSCFLLFFRLFFNDTSTPEIYTLSLHDALPIWCHGRPRDERRRTSAGARLGRRPAWLSAIVGDRKSTRLNSSHRCISYAVFCLKKKKTKNSKPKSNSTKIHI